MNLIKGASKIWNISIHLAKSLNGSDLDETTIMKNDNENSADINTIWYKHKENCLLFISVMVNKRYIYFILFRDKYYKESLSLVYLY